MENPASIVTIIINKIFQKRLKVFKAAILFGLPNYLILSLYLYLRSNQINAGPLEIVFLYLAASWTWIGPLSIWCYDEKLLNNFYRESKRVVHQDCWNNVYGIRHSHKKVLISIWTLMVLAVYILFARKYCYERLGLNGFTDPWYLMSLLSVGIQAALTGIGIYGCINMMTMVWNTYKSCDLIINPYHYDKRGGIAIYSELSSKTTLLFCTGAIYLPILLTVAAYIELAWGLYSLAVIFTVLILLSYSIPNYFLYKKYQWTVRTEAQKIASKLIPLYSRIVNEHYYADNIGKEYATLNQAFKDLMSIELNPFNVKAATLLATSGLFPILMIMINLLLTKWVNTNL